MFVARVDLVTLSDVPEEAYNSRPSGFGSFWFACASAPSLHRICIMNIHVSSLTLSRIFHGG